MNAHAKTHATLPSCLAKLAGRPRWVGWRWTDTTDKDGSPKRTKVPFQVTGALARNNDPTTWSLAAEIMTAVPTRGFDGIGLQLLDLVGFAALDLDKVRDPATGAILPWAEEAIGWGSYAEMTPSGTGFRVLGRVESDEPARHRKFKHPDGGEVEFYVNTPTGRYITVTGDRVDAAPDALNPIGPLVARLWDRVNPSDEGEGFRFDQGPHGSSGSSSSDEAWDCLPEWVRDWIAHGGTGDRSADFQSVVNALYGRVTFDTALRFLREHPSGPASKFANRLKAELRRSWQKAAESGLNNVEASDVVIQSRGFGRFGVQGFIGFDPEPCDFRPLDEAPPARSRAGRPSPSSAR